MRHQLGFLLIGLAQASASLIRSSKDPQVPPIYPIGTKNESFARTSGTLFEIDGKVSYFAGTNAWWLGHLSKNEDIDTSMRQMVDAKYKIVRVWGFGDRTEAPESNATDPNRVWYQLHNQTGAYVNYGDDGLQRLDYVVSQAEKLGLKLVIPFVNNWPDYGGFALYASIYGAQPNFYENKKSQEVYRDYIKVIVSRYRNSSAIFAWQLCNEPRCSACNTSVIYKWATDTSKYIKSLDPNHMVSLGDEGWFALSSGYSDEDGTSSHAYSGGNGVDFVANLNISTLDYHTFHLYPSWWNYPFSWGNHWIRQHADAGAKHNKTVVLEEYGSPDRGDHAKVEDPWQETVLKSTLAADQLWQFGPVNLTFNSTWLGDEFSVYIDKPEFQKLGKQHVQAMLDKKT